MLKNINKSTILVASNCRDDKKLFTKVNDIISNKFDNEKNRRISILYTPRMGFRNKTRSQLFIDTKEMIKKWKYKEKLLCEFDLIDCSKSINIERCKNKINKNSILWIMGGDTLYLMYHLKKSGIGDLIKKRVYKDNFLLIGCCAGAIVAGNSINPTFIDRANKRKHKYYIKHTYKKKYWEKPKNCKGLNLIKNIDIVPHCSTKKKNRYFTLRNKKQYCLSEKLLK